MKYQATLPLSSYKKQGVHNTFTLESPNGRVCFVKGRDSIQLQSDKVTIIFSDLKKPMKLFNNGRIKSGGPLPEDLAKDFNLTLEPVKEAKGKGKYKPPKTPPRLSLDKKIDQAILSVISLLSDRELPDWPEEKFKETINILKKINNQRQCGQSSDQPSIQSQQTMIENQQQSKSFTRSRYNLIRR